MGLDTYAYYTNPQTQKPEMMPDDLFQGVGSLCGGLFSDGQGSSFRGKVYAGFLRNAIGLDLYQEENHDIQGIADRLTNWCDSNPDLEFSGISRAEIGALAAWFRVVERNGGFVVGWW
jgi:hypothetical protein